MSNNTASEAQAVRSKVMDERRNVTSRISDMCRFVGFGLLAVFYGIKAGTGDFADAMQAKDSLLLAVGIFGVLTILLDYLQYLFAYVAVEDALTRKAEGYTYDDRSCSYKAWVAFFWMKQAAVGIGVIILFWLILASFWIGERAAFAPSA